MSATRVNTRRFLWAICIGVLLLFFAVLASCTPAPIPVTAPTETPIPPDGSIPVTVLDKNGNPFEQGVVVRVSNSSQADDFDNGGLHIESCDQNTQLIAAWAKGYEVGLARCDHPTIQLTPLNGSDNINYSWASAFGNCINCHAGQLGSTYNEMNEWLKSGHSKIFNQRYLESMYRGTDVSGNSSPLTQWTFVDNNRVRIPPVINASYRGPGYKLDFPEQPGNCAYCHAPAAIPASQQNVDLMNLFRRAGDVRAEGVTCDVCHKVFDVTLDQNGFPFVDHPGILSFKFLRSDNQIFMTGPFSNILTQDPNIPTDHHLTCSPVFSKSEFCAACHYGKFGNMTIYNSYGEWRQSSFGDNPSEADYKTCQDCHMSHMKAGDENPPSSKRQACSESDPSFQNFDHNMMKLGIDDNGKEIPQMIQDAAKLTVKFKYEPDKKNSLDVTVRVKNTKVGHKFPTDSPLRHLILVVDARDQQGTSLIQVAGDQIPTWGGTGNALLDSHGIKSYAGLPGKIFANLLVEEDTDISPTAAYWNNTKFAWVDTNSNSDTRLAPGQEDKSDYSFTVPNAGEVNITVTLVYRYAFYDLIAEKQWWDRPDIIVTSVNCHGIPTNPDQIKCGD